MSTPILSAFYFGSVEHYRLLSNHPKVIVDIGEHYERQSYRTRTRIVGPNGVQDLTVQIARRSGEKMPMRTVGLSYIETWPQQHVHAIRSAYGNAPWFIHFIDEIEAVVLQRYDRLVDLDLATMRLGMKWLGLRTEVVVSDEYVEVASGKSRAASSTGPNLPLAASELPLELLDLRTCFHPKRPLPPVISAAPTYPQIFADRHGFQPRMSVIDLVMNTGPEARSFLR
jgi:hypothetical protein